jgi:cell division control protein 6
MDENFLRNSLEKRTVFKNQATLDSSYVTEKLYGRDDVIQELIFQYRRILEEFDQPNVDCLILGKGGTGKTVTARFFARNFKNTATEKGIKIFVEYYNCIHFRSKSKIIRELLAKYTRGSGRGFSDDEALKLILMQLIREKSYMLLLIDEVHMLKSDEILSFLDLTQTFGHKSAKLSLILISRRRDWMRVENERILSRLHEKIECKPYSFEEAKKVLEYRCELAFKENVVSEGILCIIGQIVADHKNLRHGIEILRRSGIYADMQGLNHITADMVRSAANDVYPTFRIEILDQLNDQELLTLFGVVLALRKKQAPYVKIDDVFQEYLQICANSLIEPDVWMSFRKYIRTLSQLKIIASEKVIIEDHSNRLEELGKDREVTILDFPIAKVEELLIEILTRREILQN